MKKSRSVCGLRRTPRNAPPPLNPTPYTLHPAPYTLHPTPYTLHPTPYTLHGEADAQLVVIAPGVAPSANMAHTRQSRPDSGFGIRLVMCFYSLLRGRLAGLWRVRSLCFCILRSWALGTSRDIEGGAQPRGCSCWSLSLKLSGTKVCEPEIRAQLQAQGASGTCSESKEEEKSRCRGGLVFKAHRLVYHSTLGWKVNKEEK